ncbi:conserved hypothetical protein [Methylocella silvestris BL2]|uniref:DUF3616 domain-containing protein n=1 Tax=Methylocella silvestris (strain DSM 15510 / CIP 108128 / LMG 27833 / NCIMB 13906 / BL2) TaxID=395965 RepID=B8ERA3_METSB|nr:DUF3616 domain-containing protein [Methylocella silvestris]ACK50287.1 conserved hypothetical protein [Methylocella silvestris BL2]
MSKMAAAFAALLALVAASQCARAADAAALAPARQIAVAGEFINDKGKVSRDLSGIACQPELAGRRICVVIDDQSRFAQVAFLEQGALRAGPRIKLIAEESRATIVGSSPTTAQCPKDDDKFKDLDGEGVAYAAPYFYVVGSHGCSRHSGKFTPSAFITVRFRLNTSGDLVDGDGKPGLDASAPNTSVEATYRLSDALAAADSVGSSFGRVLNGHGGRTDGLNVEGLAVIDGMLYAGARAPSVDGDAFVIGAKIADLFAPGANRIPLQIFDISLALGKNTGIRDLAALPGGKLLILAGPTQDDPATPYSLFLASQLLTGRATATPVARLEDVLTTDKDGRPMRAKAEAVLPIALSEGELRTIVLFDGPANGAPAEYRAPIPQD